MIFIIDPEGNCSCGETVQIALSDYENTHDNYSINALTFFQGTEVMVEFVLTPKE